jgi:hypothetical protein
MSDYIVVLVLALVAVGAVAFPLIAGRERYDDPDALDVDLARYREALRAGTVCPRCRQANVPESRFCSECGRELGT